MKKLLSLALIAMLSAGGLTLVPGCGDSNESAGEQIENAADTAGDKIEEAADATGDKIKEEADKVEDAMN